MTAWLTKNVPPGSCILDPFGSSPRLVVEAARAGYSILVACNNPIDRFLIELIANPPDVAEYRAALADLAASQKGDQRIEPHINSLYQTQCPACNEIISVASFIWERGATKPIQRIIHCPKCGVNGEFPTTPADEALLQRLPPITLHRSRALERVTPIDDPDRALVEEALDVYLPRSLYAIFTLINKLDQLPGHRRRALWALMLSTFDLTNTLWAVPIQRTRPRQLATPTSFIERNVWSAIEESLLLLTTAFPPQLERLPVYHWPDFTLKPGTICIYEGRLRDLAENLGNKRSSQVAGNAADLPTFPPIEAVVTSIPRPNQAYWTLCALWSGWLWGREAAIPLRSVLHRRRYDWNWHTAALYTGMASMNHLLKPGTKLFELIGEIEPGFISSLLLASGLAGFREHTIALRQSSTMAQVTCVQAETVTKPPSIKKESQASDPTQEILSRLIDLAKQAVKEFLIERGEPSEYLHIHSVALTSIANSLTHLHPASIPIEPLELTGMIHASLPGMLSYQNGFLRYHGSSHALDVGYWWLREIRSTTISDTQAPIQGAEGEAVPTHLIQASLADRVEIEIVRLLIKQPAISLQQIDKYLCEHFPGWFTPDEEWINTCLESYAEQVPQDAELWRLREQESPSSRNKDLNQAALLLSDLGQRLGFSVNYQPKPSRQLEWVDTSDSPAYTFYLVASAVIGRLVCLPQSQPSHSLIVYPGGRANLMLAKLRRDPRLQSLIDQGWRFLKFRHLRRIAESDQLNRQNLDEFLVQDPLSKQDSQISFL